MSRYLNFEQQERFDRIVNDFYDQKRTNQEGLTVKVGTAIVYRQGVEDTEDIDKIKPFELEKLEAAVFERKEAKGIVEIKLYTPATEEVFRYENGKNISIDFERAEVSRETEQFLLLAEHNNLAQLNNSQVTTEETKLENDTQSTAQETENQPSKALSRDPCKIMQDCLETLAISSFQDFLKLERYISKSGLTVDNFSCI